MKITEQEWKDSQENEYKYWQNQKMAENREQKDRWRWYSEVCFPGYFEREFNNLVCADVGSGPEGVLKYIECKKKYAVDPLMDGFKDCGYKVNDGGIIPLTQKIEGLNLPEYADVIFCLNCLDHSEDVLMCLEMIKANLKVGGEMVLCVDMRPSHLIDKFHKIKIEEWQLLEYLEECCFRGKSWHVPHQNPNPTIQFCGVFK